MQRADERALRSTEPFFSRWIEQRPFQDFDRLGNP
jgi:hypothetical protein